MRHIFQHVNHISHPCWSCDNGYTSHDKLLKHIADEHSGGVLVGQGFSSLISAAHANRPQSQQVRDTPGSNLSTAASTSTVARSSPRDQNVESAAPEQESVDDKISSSGDEEHDTDGESSEVSSSEDEQSGSDGEGPKTDSASSDVGENSNRASSKEQPVDNESETLQSTPVSSKKHFPTGKLPGAGGKFSYEAIDIEGMVQLIQNELRQELGALRQQQRSASNKSIRLNRRLHDWQIIAHEVHSGAMETPAEAQLREGLEALKRPPPKIRLWQRNERLRKLKSKVSDARKAIHAERQHREQ